MSGDKYNLKRFLDAQERDYDQALQEIRSGRKRSHWMWYIFPQLKGLGFSSTANYYGIRDLDEAEAYMAHPLLRNRLIEISDALLYLKTDDPEHVLGYPDNLKLQSCMTLFSNADEEEPVFNYVLEKFFEGKPDERTLDLISYYENRKNKS